MKGIAAPNPLRRRGRWVAAGLVVLAAGVASAWGAGVFTAAASPGAAGLGATAPATQPVVREDIAATTQVTATLGYAGSWTVSGQGGGTLTGLPQAGQVISQGQALYRVDNGSPVALLYGSVPDWRGLGEGTTGEDVSQLNHDLVALGYAGRADIAAVGWDYYSAETAYGVQQLEGHLGVSGPAGTLSLGQVVFEPAATAGRHRDGQPGRAGVRAGADRDVGPARGDDPAGRLAADGGQGRRHGDGDAAGRDDHAGRGLLGRHRGGHIRVGGKRHHDNPSASEADRSGRGWQPGPGTGDGEHHHCHRTRRAGGSGDGAAGARRRAATSWRSPARRNTRRYVPVTRPGSSTTLPGWCR